MTASTRELPMSAWVVSEERAGEARPVRAEGDRQLLFLARDGDQRACRELIDRHGQRLLAIVHATNGDLGIAEDIVQEALIRALQQAEQLREEASMFPWLVRIALRVGLDYRRKVRREMLTDQIREEAAAEEASPDHRVSAAEDSSRVRAALAELKPAQRQLVVLRYFASLSVAELAEVFGKSEPAIRKDLQRARERVKKMLGDWFDAGGER
jgi:RNA polymerase sigma-70 factor, ECF subfamily